MAAIFAARPRVESLDGLRGALALSVMVYYYASYQSPNLDAGTILGRLSIYAVSAFFILSGLSLTIVHRDRFVRFSELGTYGLKRLLRIAPVLWVATSWQLIVYWKLNRSGKVVIPVDAADVLMNYSLTFGFLKPSGYLASGAWSIGNELAFYAIFPLLILLVRRGRWAVMGLLAANVGIFGLWCLGNYSSELTLTTHWRDYVQPLNQLFYFVSGVLLGILLRPGQGRRMWGGGLAGLIAALIVLPASGDLMQIVQGLNRLLFSGIAVAFVMAVYLWNPSSEGRLAKMLGFLGEISYSLYLYHPLVHQPAVRFGRNIGLSSELACWVAAVPMSVGLAALSYRFLEKPVMAWANRLTSRRNIPGRETEPSRSNDRSEISVGESRQAAEGGKWKAIRRRSGASDSSQVKAMQFRSPRNAFGRNPESIHAARVEGRAVTAFSDSSSL